MYGGNRRGERSSQTLQLNRACSSPRVSRVPAGGRVLGVSGTRMVPVITGLANPRGIAGYPPVVGTSGFVISIRMDATGAAELSDANGRRLGTDLLTLDPLNDFDIDGSDTGAGEVRFLAIKNARPGPYCLRTLDNGGADYAVNVYSGRLEPGPGRRLRRTVSSGSVHHQRFVLFENGTIKWQPLPSQTDLDADTDVDLIDAILMLGCLTGPGDPGAATPAPPGCHLSVDANGILPADFDEDQEVDLWDIAGLQQGFSGTDIPASTTCSP